MCKFVIRQKKEYIQTKIMLLNFYISITILFDANEFIQIGNDIECDFSQSNLRMMSQSIRAFAFSNHK